MAKKSTTGTNATPSRAQLVKDAIAGMLEDAEAEVAAAQEAHTEAAEAVALAEAKRDVIKERLSK